MAAQEPRKSARWTNEEDFWLEVNARPIDRNNPEELTSFLRGLQRVSGNRRTLLAVYERCNFLGIRVQENPGMLRKTELANLLGIKHSSITRILLNHPEWETHKLGSYTYLPEATVEQVTAVVKGRQERASNRANRIRAEEAAQLLICTLNHVIVLVQFGVLTGKKDDRGVWWIDRISVLEAIEMQKKGGKKWITLYGDRLTETYHRHKQQNLANQRRKKHVALENSAS